MPGTVISNTTTAGENFRHSSATGPGASASATISRSEADFSTWRRPVRLSGWSEAIKMWVRIALYLLAVESAAAGRIGGCYAFLTRDERERNRVEGSRA